MAVSDFSPLSHFKELHLLPRVLFTIGGALFFVGLFAKEWAAVLFGAGIVFAALSYNFFANLLWYDPNPPYKTHIGWSNLFQGLFSLVLAVATIYAAYFYYRYGVLPLLHRP